MFRRELLTLLHTTTALCGASSMSLTAAVRASISAHASIAIFAASKFALASLSFAWQLLICCSKSKGTDSPVMRYGSSCARAPWASLCAASKIPRAISKRIAGDALTPWREACVAIEYHSSHHQTTQYRSPLIEVKFFFQLFRCREGVRSTEDEGMNSRRRGFQTRTISRASPRVSCALRAHSE